MKKSVLLLSCLVSLFWMATQFINVYRYAVVGAIFEILWLPMILLALSLPLISLYFLWKEKFSFKSPYFWALLIMALSILLLSFRLS